MMDQKKTCTYLYNEQKLIHRMYCWCHENGFHGFSNENHITFSFNTRLNFLHSCVCSSSNEKKKSRRNCPALHTIYACMRWTVPCFKYLVDQIVFKILVILHRIVFHFLFLSYETNGNLKWLWFEKNREPITMPKLSFRLWLSKALKGDWF